MANGDVSLNCPWPSATLLHLLPASAYPPFTQRGESQIGSLPGIKVAQQNTSKWAIKKSLNLRCNFVAHHSFQVFSFGFFLRPFFIWDRWWKYYGVLLRHQPRPFIDINRHCLRSFRACSITSGRSTCWRGAFY